MLYQTILTEISPYRAWVDCLRGFAEHRHADIEIHYCMKGELEATVNKRKYTVKEGEVLLISPAVSHSFPECEDAERRVLTVIVGVSFLKKYFSFFSSAKRECYLFTEQACMRACPELQAALRESAVLCQAADEKNELLFSGNLYRICSYLIDLINAAGEPMYAVQKEIARVASIETALEMIYYDYEKPLTVEDAARATGYGKSNFCKIFKSITGDTFHRHLNRRRVESACGLLRETNLSIAEIAAAVGFEECKTFCRVFRAEMSMTPGKYRKNNGVNIMEG